MNCPNCGGLLDLEKRRCEFCDTAFTEAELFGEKAVHKEAHTEAQAEPERKLNYTEQKKLELQKEKEYRKAHPQVDESNDVAFGALVMGAFGLMGRLRMFFRELKRVVCFILLIALECGFGYLMISGVASHIFEEEIANFALLNGLVLANALVAGLICRIGRIRVGTVLVAVISILAVVWVFIYPLIVTDFAGVSAKYVAVLAVIEMMVIALSTVFAHLIYRR